MHDNLCGQIKVYYEECQQEAYSSFKHVFEENYKMRCQELPEQYKKEQYTASIKLHAESNLYLSIAISGKSLMVGFYDAKENKIKETVTFNEIRHCKSIHYAFIRDSIEKFELSNVKPAQDKRVNSAWGYEIVRRHSRNEGLKVDMEAFKKKTDSARYHLNNVREGRNTITSLPKSTGIDVYYNLSRKIDADDNQATKDARAGIKELEKSGASRGKSNFLMEEYIRASNASEAFRDKIRYIQEHEKEIEIQEKTERLINESNQRPRQRSMHGHGYYGR